MEAKQTPARHHYLPAFYQKSWCGEDGELSVFTRTPTGRLHHKRVGHRAHGWKNHLYSNPLAPKNEAGRMESDYFMPLDTRASEALGWIAEPFGAADEDVLRHRRAFGNFVCSLMFRHPADIDAIMGEIDRLIRGRIGSGPERDAFFRNQALGIARSLIDLPSVNIAIQRMDWQRLDLSPETPDLLTSDRPVIMTRKLVVDGSFLLVPIGPRSMFVASRGIRFADDWHRSFETDLVTAVNIEVTMRARNMVVAKSRDAADFVDRYFGLAPKSFGPWGRTFSGPPTA